MFLFSQPDDLCVFARISGLRCVLLTQFNSQDWRQSAKCNRAPTTYYCYIIDWEATRYGMLIHSNFITFFCVNYLYPSVSCILVLEINAIVFALALTL